MLKKVAAIALLSVVALPQLPAFSGTLVFVKDADGTLYSRGATSQTLTAKYSSGLKSSTATANGCGVIKVSASKLAGATGVLIDEVTKTLPSASQASKYFPCEGTTAGITKITLTADGDIYFPGYVPNSAHQVKLPVTSTLERSVSVNDCGIAKFSNTEAYPISKIQSVAGQTIVIANIPVGNPPICKNQILYLPQS